MAGVSANSSLGEPPPSGGEPPFEGQEGARSEPVPEGGEPASSVDPSAPTELPPEPLAPPIEPAASADPSPVIGPDMPPAGAAPVEAPPAVPGGAPPAQPGLALSLILRGLALLMGAGASIGLTIWEIWLSNALVAYVRENDVEPGKRRAMLLFLAGGLVVPMLASAVYLLVRRRRIQSAAVQLESLAWRLSPLCLTAFVPLLFRWQIWTGKDVEFLVLAAIVAWCSQKLFYRSLTAPEPFPWFRGPRWAALRDRAAAWGQRSSRWLPWVVAIAAFVFYAAYFSFFTIRNHHNLRTAAYDMAIEDNVVYNALRGKMLKASPMFGPVGTHVGHHATFFAFVLAPFYAISQRAETLLVIQAVLMGAAVIPLFLFAKNRLGPWPAAVFAALYIFYAPLHGANFYDFHYPPLGIGFVFWTAYLIDVGRYRWAALTIVLGLSVREDIALAIFAVGAYFVLSKRRPRPGAVVALVGLVYFVTMKMIVMPAVRGGAESFDWFYKDLLPKSGIPGFSGVLATVVSNPAYTLGTLLKNKKIIYLLQVITPFAFLPCRRALGFLFAMPAVLMTILTSRDASYEISFQYTSHWTMAMFASSVAILTLEKEPAAPGDQLGGKRVGSWLLAMAFAMLATSYQHGGVLQHNTARGGFWKFQFARTEADVVRYDDLHSLIAMIPPKAKVAGTEFVLPQVSNRPDAYTVRSVGIRDAEYILFPRSIKGEDVNRIRPLLENKKFGVVAEAGEFVLAKLGHPADKNEALLKHIAPATKPKPKPRPAPKPAAKPTPSAAPAPPPTAWPPEPGDLDR